VNATSTITSKGNASQDQYLQFQLDLAEEMMAANDIPFSAVEENYDGTSTDKGFTNWEWVQAILRTLEQRNDQLAQSAIDVFTRDVFLYLNKDVVRRDINRIVNSYLDDRATIVVAHSLGTIVAYDVLRTRPRNVPLFMTLGSPLGIRTIRIRLTPLSFPEGVARWENYYDDRDPIALYPLDAANFDVVPEIPNVSDIKNPTDDRHGIVGYLSRPRVVQGILS
jgi:pimeloyl-ACP methyl ester carboxylesterase